MSLTAGDVAKVTYLLTDEDGAPADATVAFTATAPDGTVTTVTPTNPAVGTYVATFLVDQNGTWAYRWAASGALTEVETGTIVVGGLATLAQIKDQLDKTSTADDVELQAYLDAVTSVIEGYCGPVVQRTRTAWVNTTGSLLILPDAPVVSVTAVTGYSGSTGTVYDLAADPTLATSSTYYLDKATGILDLPFGSWPGRVRVDYVAGLPAVPAEINLAARLMVQSLWRTQNGGAGLPALSDEPDLQQAAAETLRSPRVAMLLSAHRRAPSIA
jgi:hypothetical protein